MTFFKCTCILQIIIVCATACEKPEIQPQPPVYLKPIYYTSSAVVTTVTGRKTLGYPANKNGNLTTAHYGQLTGLAFDSKRNLFVADKMFHTIRKITPSGDVTTFAGSGKAGYTDGNGTNASFNSPMGIAIDADDNLYITDSQNNCIRKITPSGEVSTFAGSTSGINGSVDGTGTTARFDIPLNLVLDAQENLYVTDGHRVRKITPAGEVTTLAGNQFNGYVDGLGATARFWDPNGIVIGSDGNIYVTDSFDKRIRKITPEGLVTTYAGSHTTPYKDGIGISAVFNSPSGMTIDDSGNLYVTDLYVIRKITPDSVVTTIAGGSGSPYREDGIGCKSSFTNPTGITIDADGNLFVTEETMIRKITLK